MKISTYIKDQYGVDINVRKEWERQTEVWQSWYAGYCKDFHLYEIWNGRGHIKKRRKTLQLPKKSCEDWADILYNANCAVTVADQGSNELLTKVLTRMSAWALINQSIERAFAAGTGALVMAVSDLNYDSSTGSAAPSDKSSPRLEFVPVEKIYPISWTADHCTECAFVTAKTIRSKHYITLSAHIIGDNGNYIIENRIFEQSKSGDITELSAEEEDRLLGAFRSFDTGSDKRWFCLLSPAVANNIVPPTHPAYDYPFGVSIFANALDSAKATDECYDSLSNEINLGRKRVFVSDDMCEDIDGNLVFDANDISVYTVPKGFNSQSLLQAENSPLRTTELISALEANLSAYSSAVGMGKDMYKFDAANMNTAAQVYSSNSELKRKRDKHITRLENELYDIMDALCYAVSSFTTLGNINPEGLTIKFDNSTFEDTETTSNRKLREVEAEVADRAEYRMEVYKEDLETAKQRIAEVDAENAARLKAMMPAAENDG